MLGLLLLLLCWGAGGGDQAFERFFGARQGTLVRMHAHYRLQVGLPHMLLGLGLTGNALWAGSRIGQADSASGC
jgi:hypothetical protein